MSVSKTPSEAKGEDEGKPRRGQTSSPAKTPGKKPREFNVSTIKPALLAAHDAADNQHQSFCPQSNRHAD